MVSYLTQNAYSQENISVANKINQTESFHSTPSTTGTSPTTIDYVSHPVTEGPTRESKTPDDETFVVSCKRLRNSPTADKFDTFGQTVAHNLREMSSKQYLHAQKLISEVLYEGSLENLSRRSILATAARHADMSRKAFSRTWHT